MGRECTHRAMTTRDLLAYLEEAWARYGITAYNLWRFDAASPDHGIVTMWLSRTQTYAELDEELRRTQAWLKAPPRTRITRGSTDQTSNRRRGSKRSAARTFNAD